MEEEESTEEEDRQFQVEVTEDRQFLVEVTEDRQFQVEVTKYMIEGLRQIRMSIAEYVF